MKRIVFKKFAGLRKNGSVTLPLPMTEKHIDRAVWLTTQVESGGKFGCVMNYDGTGITASIGQAVAVYPKALMDDIKANDQGPLWKVLNRLNASGNRLENSYFDTFLERLDSLGWHLSEDGKCRDIKTSKLVSGIAIRKEFTGAASGRMPARGKDKTRAENWVNLFHFIFMQSSTFLAQIAIEKEAIVKRCSRTKLKYCERFVDPESTLQDIIYKPNHISFVTFEQLGIEMDLAMAMFWSNSVNAPSFALRKICKVLEKGYKDKLDKKRLAKLIIKKLGNTPFARWDDDIKNGRYQRTRKNAMKLWPKSLFSGKNAIMPANLKG